MSISVNAYWGILALLSLIGMSGCTSPNVHSSLIETIHRIPTHTVNIAGNKIFYMEAGQGDPLVLIHGFGGSMWNWEYQYTGLTSSHRVIVLDLLGSGLSDKPEGPYTPTRLVHFFEQFLDTLNITQATLVGNSMGAGLALAVALSSPDRVKSLILISGFPPNPRESIASQQYKSFLERRPPLWMAEFGNWIGGRWVTRITLKEIIHNPDLITPLVVERSFQNRHRSDFLRPLYSILDHIDEWGKTFGPRLNEIPHPTLILWGSDDRVFPPPIGKQLQKTIPNATFHLIPQAGHLPQWEQPLQVNSLISQFLIQQ